MRAPCGEDWQVLLRLLPPDWEQTALSSGAVKRLRGFDSVGDLLRTLLLHVGPGYSLRETVVRAKAAGWAEVSDVARETLSSLFRMPSGHARNSKKAWNPAVGRCFGPFSASEPLTEFYFTRSRRLSIDINIDLSRSRR